mmetsp:Transcript_72338/g.192300  ORF Transcript_72338/g.192300 Transcript_72338/m.192300 type:complete len:223 (+) Transcript_72338:164-832(+)
MLMSAFSSRQIGQSSSPSFALSSSCRALFWLMFFSAAAQRAGLSGSRGSTGSCAGAGASALGCGRTTAGPSGISMLIPDLRAMMPSGSAERSEPLSSGSWPTPISRSSSACFSRSTASSATRLACSRCLRAVSTCSLHALKSQSKMERPHRVPSALKHTHRSASSSSSSSSTPDCSGRAFLFAPLAAEPGSDAYSPSIADAGPSPVAARRSTCPSFLRAARC